MHNIKFESGEKVSKDDILFEVEGQKTAYDIVAPSDGFFYADPSLELEQEIEIDRIIGVISDEKTYDEKAIKSFLSKEIKKDKNNDNSDEHKFEDLELTNVKPHNFDQNKIRLAVIGGGAGLSQVLEITKHFEHFDLKGVYDDTLFNKELSVNGVPIIGSINIQNISNDFSDDLFDKIIIKEYSYKEDNIDHFIDHFEISNLNINNASLIYEFLNSLDFFNFENIYYILDTISFNEFIINGAKIAEIDYYGEWERFEFSNYKDMNFDSIILESPTVALDFTYYLTDGENERLLGFNVDGVSSCVSGRLLADKSEGQNFFILTTKEGEDAIGNKLNDSESKNVEQISYNFL